MYDMFYMVKNFELLNKTPILQGSESVECPSPNSPNGKHDTRYWKGKGDFNTYKCKHCGELFGERW